MKLLIATVAIACGSALAFPFDSFNARPAVNLELVNVINSNPNAKWKAGVNDRFVGKSLAEARALCGALPGPLPPVATHLPPLAPGALPANFDARTNWANCPSVAEIRDQGACGSCWAFGAVESMTDRHCIASGGKDKPHISAQDLNSCCDSCGMGCDGGFPGAAWQWWNETGIVTGGNYNTTEGCLPYTIAICEHHVSGPYPPCGNVVPTPACTQQCIPNYKTPYTQDKRHGLAPYSLDTVDKAQQDLFTNGPFEAAFTVYEDFLTYKSGVYHHVSGQVLGGHAIKIMGWGVEDNTPYWLVANSWNPTWGDNGTFKILRGSNECGIESGMVAGLPKV